jgi:two-component system sensor histidine kinase/response regulator
VPENRALLRGLLTSVGFDVREAAGGEEAFQVWREWQPHLVWMDKRMPDVDGLEATRRIRAAEQADGGAVTKILALSASALEHEREEILAAGCDDFLPKPFGEDALFEAMRRHLGLRYAYARATPRVVSTVVTGARLARLPLALLADLRNALMQGDTEQALQLTTRIGAADASLAEELRAMIRAFRLDEVEAALDDVGAGA